MRSASETIFAFGGLILMSLIFLALLVLLYISYFRMAEILRHLSNSPAVVAKQKTLGRDPVSRYFMIACVGALMLCSRQSLKNGELTLEDYESFPVGLKRIIKISFGSMVALAIVALGFVLVGRYIGWLK
jgi:sorbitol-specific phosphotransferase system component IIC